MKKLFHQGNILTLFISLSCISVPALSATITSLSEDFEAETLALNYNSFSNWNVSGGTVDTVGPTFGTPLINCQGSQVCVDVDGSTNDAADSFATKDNFAIGTYVLSFDLSGSQRPDTNTINVTFGDLNENFTLSGGAGWMTVVRIVNVSTNDFLTFGMSGGDNSGLLLDNVSVNTIPVPAAVWLFGTGLLGLVGLARRKKVA
ncbi:MAG: VPLPA-CTERM sorting domain-containing protein [Gammaproteobacteria bacterium]